MNPNSLFGRPQGGAFQAPGSNTNKTGMFGQQGSSNTPQNVGFGQSATFGQSSAFSQPSVFGQTSGQTSVFGQSLAFGQTPSLGQGSVFGQSGGLGQSSGPSPGQSSTFSTMSQPPAFGQATLAQSSSGFGGPPPSYGQAIGQSQSSVFGQTPAFGQTSAFGQLSGFGQQPPGYSASSGISQASSDTTTSIAGSAQPMSFGQSPFDQPLPSSASTTFGAAQSVVQSRGFGTSEFSFKPSNEALFKPIFSDSPEPANPQPDASQPASSSMDSSGPNGSGFSLLTGSKSGPLGFSFSQPAAALSISTPSASLTQKDVVTNSSSSSSTTGLQFTFSQPATPSSTNSSASAAATAPQPATVPSSPSSFSFSAKVLQPAPPMSLFGGSGFSQPSAFGEPKPKGEAPVGTDKRAGDEESTGEVTVFGRLGKATKRKEETADLAASSGKPADEDDAQAEVDEARHPPKRPLLRSRGPAGGLFRSAMSGLMRATANPVRRDPGKEEEPALEWGETERPGTQAPSIHKPATPPRAQAPTREVLKKAEETGPVEVPDPDPNPKTPARRAQRGESTDSLGGMTPSDATVIQCKNIPPNLNRKDIIEKHFGRFGKVRKVLCRPHKNLAIVHFQDHLSAAKAKKKGKLLHQHEILLFWQRKKQSPGEKGERPPEGEEADRDSQVTDTRRGGFQSHSSPLRQPRASAISSTVSLSRSSPVKKPSIAKSLQFDSEPQHESSSEGQALDRPVPSSLLHLIGQLAETAEEKYRLLEQRDKILRQGRPKRTDLDLSKVFVGTCPDMCPEKERYMRETRNQLSSFEVMPDTERVDHMTAIKEYSRSSADQEEPLPHELRPLPVLSRTMDYLVAQMMDQGHNNYRDWYDFVWNRTRGIRKDITQQHLCDPLTVALIEKCTRFHVHCGHHLCEKPMMTFDAKINNENMTKCMQSLKEMYQDLATRGVYCPTEAEFRQYNVLLKLNDGDILREVQQFRDEVRNSAEVKFAVQAFSALNSNNFVRFFKLVKSASYLAGCLLHRYFNQVRGKALKTLNIAHTVGSQRSTIFPMEDMVRMLRFQTTEEATDFIQQYGLSISDGMVELSRTAYQEPDLSLPQKRSETIMEKRTALIGEVVNGGPLPNPPQHIPVCSFDSQNKYRGEGTLAEPTPTVFRGGPLGVTAPVLVLKPELKAPSEVEVRPQLKPAKLLAEPRQFGEPQPAPEPAKPAAVDETGEPSEPASTPPALPTDPQLIFQPIAHPQPIRPPSPPPKPEPVYSDQDIMAELECVMEEVVQVAVCEVASAGADYATLALTESSGHMEAVVSEVVQQMLRDVSTAEIQSEQQRIAQEKRKIEEARRKQEHEAFLAQFSDTLCSEITQEVLTNCIRDTAASEIQLAVEEKAARVSRCSDEVCTSLVEETLDGEITLLVKAILEAELQRIHKYIKRWRDVVAVRRQLKRQMRGFPAAPCCVDPHFKLRGLAPSAPSQPSLEGLARGMVNLGNAGNMALSSTRLLKMRQESIHQMTVHFIYQQLLNESMWKPLDLPTLVVENIPNPPDRIFWKATLLLPSEHESVASVADGILTDWLEAKLGGGESSEVTERESDGMLRTLCVSSGLREAGPRTHTVHVSVKASRGPLSEDALSKMEERRELQGTGALLMLLPALSAPGLGSEDQDVPLLSALLQLKQLQQASAWHCPLPLAILVPGPDKCVGDTHKLEQDLMLSTLVEDGLISEHTFIHIPETTSDLQGSEQVTQAVRWLLARAPAPSLLSSQTLVQFVESGLCREFYARLYGHRQDRARAGLPCQDPAPVIQLYNAVLAHLAGLVSSQHLLGLSWPPGEFALPETRDLVPHLGWNSAQHLAWLRTAILSLQIPHWDLPPVTASWPQLCTSIFQYGSQIPASPTSQPLLMSRLENLLGRVRSATALDRWEEEGMEKEGPSFQQIPWDEAVDLCIDHKLKDWQPPDGPVCEDAVTEDGEVLVYFPREGLMGFQPPPEWVEAVRRTHREKQQEAEGDRASPGGLGLLASAPLRQRLFHSLMDGPDPPAPALDITHTPAPQELLPQRVLQSLQEEKAHSQRFEEQLQRWLKVDPLDSPSLPLFMPTSLLSMTHIMTPVCTASRPATTPSVTQEVDTDDPLDIERNWLRGAPVSVAQRLKELDRLILASREEELACSLKLTSLLNIVED